TEQVCGAQDPVDVIPLSQQVDARRDPELSREAPKSRFFSALACDCDPDVGKDRGRSQQRRVVLYGEQAPDRNGERAVGGEPALAARLRARIRVGRNLGGWV